MKKHLTKFIALLLIIFYGALLTGCRRSGNNKIKFVTSCYPVNIIALNLTENIEGVEVINMSENQSGCLHNFQIQSEDLKNIEKSTAFIINGAGMENFLNKVVYEIPKVKIIDSSIGINLIEEETECTHNHGDGENHHHHHHESNPHIWLSVENYIKQVQNVTNGLIIVDPTHEKTYKENCEKYISKLNELKNQLSVDLNELKGKDIITFHKAFSYFAKDFGLNIAGTINDEPENEPSAKQISDVINTIKEKNIKSIFTEPQYSSSSADIIAKETGVKIYTLDPAVTGENSKDSYINIMKENAKTLKSALN
ncbi:MAG: zinc ABC transporter substrate-binding protein [Clostridia bacterium]|nr:zinc ABC transporter substrate-binding protein [Clostridia bacterium]